MHKRRSKIIAGARTALSAIGLLAILGGVVVVQTANVKPAFAATDVDTYPAQWKNVPMDSVYDTWREWNRECTSYVAWMLSSANGFNMPFHDNASNWAADAKTLGYTINSSPAVGAVALSSNHVAYTVAFGNGTVTVQEYNEHLDGTYDKRTVPASSFQYIHFADLIGGPGDLNFVKTKNTTSGHVEIYTATMASAYRSGLDVATWFSPSDANNGWFQMDGPDLYFVKTTNTGSGRVEVHTATQTSGYQNGAHYVAAFGLADAGNGWFQMDDVDHDGIPDLVFIKTRNTGSGRVEFFVASGRSGYGQVTIALPTAFSPTDANNGWFQAQGADLVFVKTRNTGSGQVEYFRASASSAYSQVAVALPTALSPADQNNGWFSSEDANSDGMADLVFIKTHNPGSGQVELFVVDGSRAYSQVIIAITTRFSPADASNGWFQLGSKQ